jgi:PAS domain S-box-containing protein
MIESINLALARMTGWSVEEAQGSHHNEVIHWAHRGEGQDLNEAVENGWPQNETSVLYVEGNLEYASGGQLSAGITYAPLFDAQGKLLNIIANVRDITKFIEAEEAKTTFISVISHELKTPVSVIKGYASTLGRDDVEWDAKTVRSGMGVIEEETNKLAELIDNMLDVSRLQIGTFRLDFGPVAMDQLCEKVAQKFRPQTAMHQITVDFPADFPVIQGDVRRLSQVLDNLISNAIKYSPKGGAIIISGEELTNGVQISVRDEGIGLDPAKQEMIFDRFYRVDNALTRDTQGAGLGLYIVRSILEAHGGHIWVESESGKGTTFNFELPFTHD